MLPDKRSHSFETSRGKKDGLSRFGTLLEKLACYIVFITRAARQKARFSAPYRGEIPTARGTLSPDAIVYDIGANNGDDRAWTLGQECFCWEKEQDVILNLVHEAVANRSAGIA